MEHHTHQPHETGVETVLDETIDLEEYAKEGKQPPLATGYRIRINGIPYVVPKPVITGREILTLAGKLPPEDFILWIKYAGQKLKRLGLDETADLRRAGVEKFKVLPNDQTEGC